MTEIQRAHAQGIALVAGVVLVGAVAAGLTVRWHRLERTEARQHAEAVRDAYITLSDARGATTLDVDLDATGAAAWDVDLDATGAVAWDVPTPPLPVTLAVDDTPGAMLVSPQADTVWTVQNEEAPPPGGLPLSGPWLALVALGAFGLAGWVARRTP